MKIREIMTDHVTTIDAAETVARAEELMNAERIRHLPVVDGDLLVGIVSHRDVLAASLPQLETPTEEDDLAWKNKLHVDKIMHGFVETVRADTEVTEAADKLTSLKIGCLPVVDDALHVLGIVTEADFVQLARDLLLSEGRQERRRA